MSRTIKKIGLTTNETYSEDLKNSCDEVIVISNQSSETFYDLVKEYPSDELYVEEVYDLDLQLIQLFKGLAYLNSQNKIIHFINKGKLSQFNDREYFNLLFELAKSERGLLVLRTKESVTRAKSKGTAYGRPQVDDEVIEQIQYLYLNQRKTIREIAKICNVSIGTVHKYSLEANKL